MQINYLSYFLASIIAYLGLLAGTILIKLAPEEQKPGEKYFILLRKMLFLAILAALFYFYKANSILLIALLSIMTALMLNKRIDLQKPAIAYMLLGMIFYLSSKIINLFIIESVLIFLYGIANASLALNLKKRNYYSVFVKSLWFFAPVILLNALF